MGYTPDVWCHSGRREYLVGRGEHVLLQQARPRLRQLTDMHHLVACGQHSTPAAVPLQPLGLWETGPPFPPLAPFRDRISACNFSVGWAEGGASGTATTDRTKDTGRERQGVVPVELLAGQ